MNSMFRSPVLSAVILFYTLTYTAIKVKAQTFTPETIHFLSELHGENAAWRYDVKANKFAVVAKDGKLMSDFIFDRPQRFYDGVALVMINSKFRLVDSTGNLSDKEYSFLHYASENRLISPKNDNNGDYYYPNGNFAYSAKSENGTNSPRYRIVTKEKKKGILNNFGETIVPPIYDEVEDSMEGGDGYIDALSGTKKVTYSFQTKKTVTTFEPVANNCFDCEFKDVKTRQKGYRDHTGKVVIPPYYKKIYKQDGYLFVSSTEGSGVFDTSGQTIIYPEMYYLRYNKTADVFECYSKAQTSYVINNTGEVLGTFGRYMPVALDKERVVFTDNDKYGIANMAGEVLLPVEFDEIKSGIFEVGYNDCAMVRKNSLYGLVDFNGRWIVPLEFNKIQFPIWNKGYVFLKKNKKYSLFNLGKQIGTGFIYDNIYTAANGLFFVVQGKNSNLLQSDGKLVLDTYAEKIEAAGNGLFWIKQNNKWSLYNSKGQKVAKNTFWDVKGFKNGRALVRPIELSIDPDLFMLYSDDSAASFLDGTSNRKEHWVTIDTLGKIDRSRYFDAIGKFQGYQALATRNGKVGFIWQDGKEIVPLQFIDLIQPHRKFVKVKKETGYGLFHSGKLLIPCEFEEIGQIYQGYVFVLRKKTWTCFDTSGVLISQIRPEYLKQVHSLPAEAAEFGKSPEENGWIRIRQNDKWGWWDPVTAALVIDCLYDVVTPFHHGLARVRQSPYSNDFWINQQGEFVFNLPRYTISLFE